MRPPVAPGDAGGNPDLSQPGSGIVGVAHGERPVWHVAIHGMCPRGGATAGASVVGVHLLATFSDGLQGMVVQLQVAPGANEMARTDEMRLLAVWCG